MFDGNAIFSFTCSDGESFTSVSICSNPNSSFVEVARDAITASSTAVAVITWETVSRSGTARASSTGAAPVGVPRDTVKFIGEFTVYTSDVLVAGYRVCATMKSHWSWVVRVSPHLQLRCELLWVCRLHGRVPVVVLSSADDVTNDPGDKFADCAHLKFGSTCCWSSRACDRTVAGGHLSECVSES